jgi:hypothetical protein
VTDLETHSTQILTLENRETWLRQAFHPSMDPQKVVGGQKIFFT